jgi:hypothetical protein
MIWFLAMTDPPTLYYQFGQVGVRTDIATLERVNLLCFIALPLATATVLASFKRLSILSLAFALALLGLSASFALGKDLDDTFTFAGVGSGLFAAVVVAAYSMIVGGILLWLWTAMVRRRRRHTGLTIRG